MAYLESEIIESLRELLADDFVQLVSTFIDDGERRLDLISKALVSNDLKTICDEAHGLKGSSQNIGATALAEITEKVENQTRKGDGSDLQQDFSSIQQLFAATANELRSL